MYSRSASVFCKSSGITLGWVWMWEVGVYENKGKRY